MPKTPGGVNKATRIQVLLEVLRRWGRQDKGQINQNVAAALGVSSDELKKVLYEDLRELVAQGTIRVEYLSLDGKLIDDYQPEVHKSVRCIWLKDSSAPPIPGAGALEEAGASLWVSETLKDEVWVDDGRNHEDNEFCHLFFNLHAQFFSIRIRKEALPVTLIVTRTPNEGAAVPLKIGKHLEVLEKSYGRRLMLLRVSNTGVSASDGTLRDGHFLLKLVDQKSGKIQDLGSTNGTHYLTPQEAVVASLVEQGLLLGEHTATQSWNHREVPIEPLTLAKPHASISVPFPLLVQASDSFRLLLRVPK